MYSRSYLAIGPNELSLIYFGNLIAYIMEPILDFMSDESFCNLKRASLMTTRRTPDVSFFSSIIMQEIRRDVKTIAPVMWTITWLPSEIIFSWLPDDVQGWKEFIVEEEFEAKMWAGLGLTSDSILRVYIEARRVSMDVWNNFQPFLSIARRKALLPYIPLDEELEILVVNYS